MATIRHPAVAGRFYPGRPDALLRDVRVYTEGATEKIAAIGCIAPHAGYMYSGHVAGAVYARLKLPRRFIVLCPNHTGQGEPLSIMSSGDWLTPLGDAPIDHELGAALKAAFDGLHEDTLAHQSEHATEVHVPFLQALAPDFKFVPITVGTGRFEVLAALGEAIADVLATVPGVLMIASSDMNHYESDRATRVKDHKAIEQILQLNPRGLYDVVHRENITMCGVGPAVAMLTAALRLGAQHAELVKYATSADTSGDYDYCVGYAGVVVY